ncbi:hypothetical protein ACHWQZ_G017451 [Mnemiopsis leidyi]
MTSDGYKNMKKVLRNELDPKVLKHLPELTTWDDSLNNDLSRPEDSVNSNFIVIKDTIEKRLIESDVPSLNIMACSQEVYRLLGENFNPGARPRCTAVCPRCRLPCNKSIGHYSEPHMMKWCKRLWLRPRSNGIIDSSWQHKLSLCLTVGLLD